MGVSSSRVEEDKALQLCRERKRLVRQALDGRCSLAAAHVTYIQSLRSTGIALGMFVELDATTESSMYPSTTATPEPLALTDKSFSHFSNLSPTLSQQVDGVESLSPAPSDAYNFQENCMKTGIGSLNSVEEKSSFHVNQTSRSTSSTPQDLTPRSAERGERLEVEHSHTPSEQPWDYFGPAHTIDAQFSFHPRRQPNNELDDPDNVRRLREEEGIPDLEDEGKGASSGSAGSDISEDEFSEPSMDDLVRRFENHRASDPHSVSMSPTLPLERTKTSETEVLNGEHSAFPDSTPVITTKSAVTTPTYEKKTTGRIHRSENKPLPKDFLTCIKEIESLFLKASESGKEVPRMLEANKMHFRPIFPGQEGKSRVFALFKDCLSCGEDPIPAPDEVAQPTMKYLTWHRTASSRSSSSRNPLGAPSKDDSEDIGSNIFENFCMNSGSHASTLDRLYAWERKLYDEVKASGIIRREYDMKCKILRQQDSTGQNVLQIDKTRAAVKDLHSRIRVAIHRIDTISRRIEELRDKELQPQLEELIEGLSRMWEMMFECHARQFKIISEADKRSIKISIQSEARRAVAIRLENELSSLSSSFLKWMNSQKSYVQAINGWLHKCVVSLQRQKSSRRKRKEQEIPLSELGPPIFLTCDVWFTKLELLSVREVADCMKMLAADAACLLPPQEKKRGKSFLPSQDGNDNNVAAAIRLRDEAAEERFGSSLVRFLEHLNGFALSSVNMYGELENAIAAKKAH
ncbi:hypothetical protein Syun_031203 [Stephania yunnanensis]|uniref:BZIP transcription factor n=1 Tax=Stephania yunnanensis TaxID=152371 RepID=A0AAP0DZ19_9MAGN